MSRFVRASKFRHVFGTGSKPEQCYLDLKPSRNAHDSNLIKANPKYLAVCWEAAGGGAFAVIDQKEIGKTKNFNLFTGHKSVVLDVDFNPFNDQIVASCSEDCKVNIWTIPDQLAPQSAPSMTLNGHSRKVGQISFHPAADNVIASSSGDLSIKLWDITNGKEKLEILGHSDAIQSFSFNDNGTMLASTSKDKKVRVFDVRQKKEVWKADAHMGVKPQRCVWLGDTPRIVTTGFSKMSDRQLWVWDMNGSSTPLCTVDLDTSSGVLMPFYDVDTKLLFLSGKGDGNIRYFEFVDEKPWQFPIADYGSRVPQRGVAFLPKRACDVNNIEIAKAFKLSTDSVEPISFTVPRKADHFQADIFPDAISGDAGLSCDAFFNGETASAKRVSLEGGFVAGTKKIVDFAAPPPPGQDKKKDLDNPQNEKELREAWHKLKDEKKILEDKLAQAQVQIRSLEIKLAEK